MASKKRRDILKPLRIKIVRRKQWDNGKWSYVAVYCFSGAVETNEGDWHHSEEYETPELCGGFIAELLGDLRDNRRVEVDFKVTTRHILNGNNKEERSHFIHKKLSWWFEQRAFWRGFKVREKELLEARREKQLSEQSRVW